MSDSCFKMTEKRITASNKKIINNDRTVDVNQLVPIKYKWAWNFYLDGCANHWMPTEVSMQKDIEQWKNTKTFTDQERHLIKRVLGFFATAETLVGNNLVLAVYKKVDNPEARQYLLRQAFEEAIHVHTFQYIVQSLGLDEGEMFNMYREAETIYNKDEYTMSCTDGVLDPNLDTTTTNGLQRFLKNLVGFYVITEGIFFYGGFVSILSFGRQNRLPGICEQIQYILRDESIHMNFGIELINTIIAENPDTWTEEFKIEIIEFIKKAVELECQYIEECLPDGILGLNQDLVKQYVCYIADRRFDRLKLTPQYGKVENPFPWMSEIIDLKKEKNFFETRVTEYQTGGALEW